MKDLVLWLLCLSLLLLANVGLIWLGLGLLNQPDNIMVGCGIAVLWGLGFGNCLIIAKIMGVK